MRTRIKKIHIERLLGVISISSLGPERAYPGNINLIYINHKILKSGLTT